MSLIDHLERHLGKIGGSRKQEKLSGTIQAIRFQGRPREGSSTFVTLGLSKHVLDMENGRKVRQELVFATYNRFEVDAIVSFLLTFAGYLVSQHRALLRGDVVGPAAPIIPGSPLSAVYATIPIIFPDSFAGYAGSSPETVFVWVVPLYVEEAGYIRQKGWRAFEDLLDNKKADLLDLQRSPVV